MSNAMRAGIGYDIHPLVDDRPLVLGGVKIDAAKGPRAHSDGDVAAHAIIDAIFGAAGLGDIGQHFPPTDNRYKDAPGPELLARCQEILAASGHRLVNVDCTVFLEQPSLEPHKKSIAAGIAHALGIAPDAVNVKAATMERLGPIGAGQAIAAQAIALVEAVKS